MRVIGCKYRKGGVAKRATPRKDLISFKISGYHVLHLLAEFGRADHFDAIAMRLQLAEEINRGADDVAEFRVLTLDSHGQAPESYYYRMNRRDRLIFLQRNQRPVPPISWLSCANVGRSIA